MAKTEKDTFRITLPLHESNFVKKCAISANMTFQDFISATLREKSFESMNEFRSLAGLPELAKTKVLRVKIPAKQKLRTKGEL